jgi:hypothetical protein
MAETSQLACIALELDMGLGYARTAQAAYDARRSVRGDAALKGAWAACGRAKSMIAKREAEELHQRLLGLEAFLRGIEESRP